MHIQYPFLLSTKMIERVFCDQYQIDTSHCDPHWHYNNVFDQLENPQRQLCIIKNFLCRLVEEESFQCIKNNFQRFLKTECYFLGVPAIHLNHLKTASLNKNTQLVLILCILYYFT